MQCQRTSKTKTSASNQRTNAFTSRQPPWPAYDSGPSLLQLHSMIGNRAMGRMLQTKLKVNAPGDEYEREADAVAELMMRTPEPMSPRISDNSVANLHSPAYIQRKCAECESNHGLCPQCAEEEKIQRKPFASTLTPLVQRQSKEPAVRTEIPSPGLVVEDEADTGRGQMKKSEFLAQVRSEVCRAANEAMAGTGRSTEGCPYLDYWFEFYSRKDSAHIERALRGFAPETARAATAKDYIPIIAARVRRSVAIWAKTGEITGVPQDLRATTPKAGGEGGGKGSSGAGRLLFKGRSGGPAEGGDVQAIHAELGSGRSLDGSVKSRMESAFGVNFSGVRIHTDPTAQELSSRLNARAFTIGQHIAFGASEYQPGTLIGDALMAHELAHVVQQAGGIGSEVQHKGGSEYNALEEDADVSAIGAMMSAWGGMKGALKDIGSKAMPRLRSGLQLQRCVAAAPASLLALEGAGVTAGVTVGGLTVGETVAITAVTLGTAVTVEETIRRTRPEAEPEPLPRIEPIPTLPEPEERRRRRCPYPTGLHIYDPIPITWFKPVNDFFYPREIVLRDGTKLDRDDPNTKLPDGTPVGVNPKFWPSIGKVMQLIPQDRKGKQQEYKDVLAHWGYVWGRSMQPDHVQDLDWEGPDAFGNLWPYEASTNLSAGSSQNVQQQISFCLTKDGPKYEGKRIGTIKKLLYGRYFEIKRFLIHS